jgi:hypothetical protein
MKKAILCLMILSVFSLSCGYRGYLRWFRPKVTIMEVIKFKEEIDRSENPARKHLILKDLREDLVSIRNAVVKDVVPSNNIDYEFCVILDIPYEKGNVECHIYSKNVYEKEDIKSVARLKKGRSVIDVVGEFNRFFTLLDEAFTKIEIINASIALRGEK